MVNFRTKYFSERILGNTDSVSNVDVEKANEEIQNKCQVSGCLTCNNNNSSKCQECFRGFNLLSESGKCQEKEVEGKKCEEGEYRYDGKECVLNQKFDSNCKEFTLDGKGPVCKAGKCEKGYGLSMPYFGGICVKCLENCVKCSNSYSCSECDNKYKLLDRNKCVEEENYKKENDERTKKKTKGCINVENGKCIKCEPGFSPNDEGNKCEVVKTFPKLDREQKETIGKIFFEQKVMEDEDIKKKIMKKYKYLLETKLNIDGNKNAFKNYYIYGPKRFSPIFPIKFIVSSSRLRRGLKDDYPINLNCVPTESEESDGKGSIHNLCESDEKIEPENVFCNTCTIEASPVDGGISLPEKVKNDNELPAEIDYKTIEGEIEKVKEETIQLTNFNIKKDKTVILTFGNKKPENGVNLTVLITFMKKSRRNRILEENDNIIQVEEGSFKSLKEDPTKGTYTKPNKYDEENDEIIDGVVLGENIIVDMSDDEIKKKIINNGDSLTNPVKSSSGLSGGAIAAIVIVSCVVVISIIAIAIAIKTKAIGGVKPAYETANNFSTTSGKTVKPEQVYI